MAKRHKAPWLSLSALVACGATPHSAAAPSAAAVRARPDVAAAAPTGSGLAPAPTRSGPGARCDTPGLPSRFTLVHFNDMQARYADLLGGKSRWAYVAGYVRALKAEGPTLALDAGDDYEKGSIAELRSMGETTRQMLQAMPIDVRTIGNHDFAYGEAAVVRDVLMSAHPVLSANVGRGLDKGPFAPYARVDVGCVRVGVVGLTTYNYGADDQPTRDPYDGVFHYDDRLWQILDEEVKKHRAEVDVMIALTHLGQTIDVGLAHAVAGIDLIVGAHSEDVLDKPLTFHRGNGAVYVLQAGHYARTLGRAEVVVGADRRVSIERYRIVNVDETLPVAQDVSDLAAKLEREFVPDARATLAVVESPIGVGKPMADLVWRAAKERWGIDALVIGKDVFWEGLPAGPLTLQRLYESVYVQREPAGTPGFSSLYLVEMTGREVHAARARLIVPSPSAPPAAPGVPPVEYAMYVPDSISPGKTYRVAIDKRALTYPNIAFYGPPRFPAGKYAGELIDVLEAYARARTAKGLSL